MDVTFDIDRRRAKQLDGWMDGWMERSILEILINGWMDGQRYEWINGKTYQKNVNVGMGEWNDGWMDGLMDGWMDGWVDGQMGG